MIGFINKITTQAGKRDEVIKLVLQGSDNMSGCRSYVVAADSGNPNVIWVTEIWDNLDAQQASLENPTVKQAIVQAMSLITGFENIATTTPSG